LGKVLTLPVGSIGSAGKSGLDAGFAAAGPEAILGNAHTNRAADNIDVAKL